MGRESELHPAGVLSGVIGAVEIWLNKTAGRMIRLTSRDIY
jgi:hypothetical protein